MSIDFIIHFHAKPHEQDSFATLIEGVKQQLPLVDGCQQVVIYRNSSDPCRYTLVETWASKKHHTNNSEAMISAGHWAHIVSHLEAPPVGDYHERV